MTISKFDAATARAISAELMEAMNAVAAKHGVTIKNAGGKFTDITLTAKFEITVGDTQAAEDSNRKQFEMYARICGANPEWFGKEFISGTKRFKVTGIKPGNAKNCILITDHLGKGYRCSPEMVRANLGA